MADNHSFSRVPCPGLHSLMGLRCRRAVQCWNQKMSSRKQDHHACLGAAWTHACSSSSSEIVLIAFPTCEERGGGGGGLSGQQQVTGEYWEA